MGPKRKIDPSRSLVEEVVAIDAPAITHRRAQRGRVGTPEADHRQYIPARENCRSDPISRVEPAVRQNRRHRARVKRRKSAGFKCLRSHHSHLNELAPSPSEPEPKRMKKLASALLLIPLRRAALHFWHLLSCESLTRMLVRHPQTLYPSQRTEQIHIEA
jgi:hypothetical protein